MPKLRVKKHFAMILLDFPRTVKADRFKEKVLIPFFTDNLSKFLAEKWDEPETKDLVRQLRQQAQEYHENQFEECPVLASSHESKRVVIQSIEANVKWYLKKKQEPEALVRLRSSVWTFGYKNETLRTELQDDVQESFVKWKKLNIEIGVYSSTSVSEQKMLLKYTSKGDLRKYIKWFFDSNIGHKSEAKGYEEIIRCTEHTKQDILFITDYLSNGQAADEAGLKVCFLDRNQSSSQTDFASIQSLFDLLFGSSKST